MINFDNKLQEDIFHYFSNSGDFYFHGYTGTFSFRTWDVGQKKYPITSKKPHGNKDTISATVSIFSNSYPDNDKYGVEIKIEMYMWGYQTEEVVFRGWVEDIEQLKTVCHAVGL